MHVYCDESGNTGVDLLSREQPVFALASTSLDLDAANALVAPLLRQGQREAKYAKLRGTGSGQRALATFLSSSILKPDNTKFTVIDKKFYLISQLVDKVIEPTLYEAGIDLYERDGHVGLANIWYYTGHTIFPPKVWDSVIAGFLRAIRRRDSESFHDFDRIVSDAWEVASCNSRDFATGLAIARGRLREFIGVYKDVEVFDPACDAFAMTIQKWMDQHDGLFDVTHDRSKPLKRNEAFLRTLMTPASSRLIGYGKRKAELPLRISELTFGDSAQLLPLQVADIIAGAAVDCCLAISGRRPKQSYHDALINSQFPSLFVGGLLPSVDDIAGVPESPCAGEQSIPDGQAEFLSEIGYFSKKTRF